MERATNRNSVTFSILISSTTNRASMLLVVRLFVGKLFDGKPFVVTPFSM